MANRNCFPLLLVCFLPPNSPFALELAIETGGENPHTRTTPWWHIVCTFRLSTRIHYHFVSESIPQARERALPAPRFYWHDRGQGELEQEAVVIQSFIARAHGSLESKWSRRVPTRAATWSLWPTWLAGSTNSRSHGDELHCWSLELAAEFVGHQRWRCLASL